jgi:membrane-associated protease RseP (regulator of RpoE activity)
VATAGLLLSAPGAQGATAPLQQLPAVPPAPRAAAPPAAAGPGWIGIFYEGSREGGPRLDPVAGVGSAIVVSDVAEDSPALRAGLRPGDLIVGINGRSVSPDGFRSLHIQEGDRIRLRVLRDGAPVDTWVTAGRPPAAPVRTRVSVASRDPRIDSLRTRIILEMDSILVSGTGDSRSVIRFIGPGAGGEFRGPSPTATPGAPESDPGLPFHLFVFRSSEEGAGSHELEGLHGTLAGLRKRADSLRAEGSSMRVEARRVGGEMESMAWTLTSAREQLEAEERAVRARREVVASRAGGGPPPPAVTALRPLTPYILGQRVVAGAELTPLNPELAQYFQGEEGLLVLQVLEGSPAREAGMMAGDIVTRVGTRRVRTLDEVRAVLDRRGDGPVQVTLVRKGRTVLLSLPH